MPTTLAGGKTRGMPKKARDAAMTPDEFRSLLEAAGLADRTKGEIAALIPCSRSHVYRWLSGDTPIDEKNADYLRKKLKPKKRKR